MRRQFAQTGTNTFRIRRQIKWAEGTHLAVSDEASVGFHANNRAVKNRHRFADRPRVGRFVQREFNAMSNDAGDFHAARTMEVLVILLNPKLWRAPAPSRDRAVSTRRE